MAAYGKIPALGDFFRIGTAPGFVSVWDGWLQTTLSAARVSLGGRWQECYMSAPIWRFALAPGLAGPGVMLGVMMPSVDRVGRNFPLTLVVHGAGRDAMAAHELQGDLYVQLEDIALSALEDAMTRDRLAEALAQVAITPKEGAADGSKDPKRHSIWSAMNGGSAPFTLICEGLPSAAQASFLFDPKPETATQKARI